MYAQKRLDKFFVFLKRFTLAVAILLTWGSVMNVEAYFDPEIIRGFHPMLATVVIVAFWLLHLGCVWYSTSRKMDHIRNKYALVPWDEYEMLKDYKRRLLSDAERAATSRTRIAEHD